MPYRDMEKIKIPSGTILYRASDNICNYTSKICNQTRKCSNTTKKGVYFSTYILQAIAMSVEYGRDLELGIFITKAPITVYLGKYSFRNIHPERWKSNWIVNRKLLENEDVSHFNSTQPLFKNNMIPPQNRFASFKLTADMGEVFLTKKEELDNIELKETYKIKLAVLEPFLKSEFYSKGIRAISLDDIEPYILSGSIEPYFCSPSKNGGKRKTRRLVRV